MLGDEFALSIGREAINDSSCRTLAIMKEVCAFLDGIKHGIKGTHL